MPTITRLIAEAKKDDESAVNELCEMYMRRVANKADEFLRAMGSPRRIADGEDVAIQVLQTFQRRVRANQFSILHDENDLWRLLVTITRRKVIKQIDREKAQKRGEGAIRGESALEGMGGIHEVADAHPSLDDLRHLAELIERVNQTLNDVTLQQVFRYRLEGHSNQEIADLLPCSIRSVNRKMQLIREAILLEVES